MDGSALENSRDYYGKVLRTSADLRTDACTMTEAPSPEVRAALARVHPEVRERYYGCGLVAPDLLEGRRILDLGCGAGQDCYVLSQLVGPEGSIVGVDATPEQLDVARRHIDHHRRSFGYERSNVAFLEGDISRLAEIDLDDAGFDVIVSNCVINLVEDKDAVFREAHSLLAPGGELYFSDVYADRRLDPGLRLDPELHGECLAGALYWGDFLASARNAGFRDPRLVDDRPLNIGDERIRQKLDPASFHSATWRLFKIPSLEPECEDYGQAVIYRGTVRGRETRLRLDNGHEFEAGRVFPVCGNTFLMLQQTRFAWHFDFIGDFTRHFGVFPGCGTSSPFSTGATPDAAPCC